jgi:hypothetical protein
MSDEDAERVVDGLLDQISGVVDALLDATGSDPRGWRPLSAASLIAGEVLPT